MMLHFGHMNATKEVFDFVRRALFEVRISDAGYCLVWLCLGHLQSGFFSVMVVMPCTHILVRNFSWQTQAYEGSYRLQLNPDWRTSDALNMMGSSDFVVYYSRFVPHWLEGAWCIRFSVQSSHT